MSKTKKPLDRARDKEKQKEIMNRRKEDRVANALKRMHFSEYVDFISSPWRTFFFGFLKGTGMGLGLLLGVAIVMAILTYIINLLGGVPVVGEWVEGLGKIIQAQ